MKKWFITVMMAFVAISSYSQNRWNIYAAGSIAHDCGGYFDWNADGNTGFNWGGGALLGSGYELNFNKHWSLTPSLEFSYTDNGAYYNKTGKPAYSLSPDSPNIWSGSWAVNVPITAGFRFPIGEKLNLKIDAGIYLSEAFHVTHFVNTGNADKPILKKQKAKSDFGNDFQLGYIGGVALETGNQFSYFFRTQYSLLSDRWSSSTLTLSLGIKYYF